MGGLEFEHVWEPPAESAAPTLLLLHGTGGHEQDLLPLGRRLAPEAALLSPRGRVLERGMPRFFRRLAEGVFDLEDLVTRTAELAAFLRDASTAYQFDPRRLIAVGFSNGANIAASLLLLHPGALGGAVLFRAMVPIVPDPLPLLPATPVLLSNGREDPLVSRDETERLADLLRRSGAAVTLDWQPAGHELTHADVDRARDWLSEITRHEVLR
jgi:phospholipase/carboxylesterase